MTATSGGGPVTWSLSPILPTRCRGSSVADAERDERYEIGLRGSEGQDRDWKGGRASIKAKQVLQARPRCSRMPPCSPTRRKMRSFGPPDAATTLYSKSSHTAFVLLFKHQFGRLASVTGSEHGSNASTAQVEFEWLSASHLSEISAIRSLSNVMSTRFQDWHASLHALIHVRCPVA